MDELYSMLRGIVDSQRDLQERVARLETLEAMLYENNNTFPTVPAPYSGQLHQTSNGVWVFDAGITDGTHPLGRWKSIGGPQPAQMGQYASDSGLVIVNAPTTGQQVANFLIPPNSLDIYIYFTVHILHVVGQNNVGRYWSISNDINTATTLIDGVATVTKILPYNRTVTAGSMPRVSVATVDTSVTGASTIYIEANALWYVTLGD